MPSISIEQTEFAGWSNCYRLSNGVIDLIVTTQIGPRIIRLGFVGADNLFCVVEEQAGKTGGDEWRIYGGHRFWHAPESMPRTYYPDNFPVTIGEHDGYLRVTQPVETTTYLQKEIDIRMDADANHVRVTHRLTNRGMWAIEVAPWALSVMRAGGTAVIPLPPRGTHPENLLPANSLTLWAYSDMSDPRWTWGNRYILLRQDSQAKTPQKIGVDVPDGWSAYVVNGFCFLKRFAKQPGATYPDMGSTMETFTNDFMLELETLGPLTFLQPSASVEHVEDWYLFRDVQTPRDDAGVASHILPLVSGSV